MTNVLWEAMRRHHPNAVRLGGVCYVRLEGGNLAKAELIAGNGYYDGFKLTILNPGTGPVDTLTIRRWICPAIRLKKTPAMSRLRRGTFIVPHWIQRRLRK